MKVSVKILNSGIILKTFTHVFCLFVCCVALCPKSTAMVMVGRSVHLTTLFREHA